MNDGVLLAGAPVRLAVLDEHGMDVDALSRWLDRNAPDLALVAADDDWLRLVRNPAFPSDVVLLDSEPVGPVSLAARVRACRSTGAAVLLIAEGPLSEEASGLVVAGVVPRRAAPGELAEAVRAATTPSGRRPIAPPLPPRLSAGELRALRLYAAGSTTNQVAQEMGVGYETVKTYLRRVRAKYAKAGRPAGRRAELVRRAAEDGLLG